ncbi:hypothetical protein, partial [Pandoraea morbifera]|uniref:hypothetical protein n=1 Tax=Pandoraea morbifera TaxID=2508300 RepID=UPI001C2D600A
MMITSNPSPFTTPHPAYHHFTLSHLRAAKLTGTPTALHLKVAPSGHRQASPIQRPKARRETRDCFTWNGVLMMISLNPSPFT